MNGVDRNPGAWRLSVAIAAVVVGGCFQSRPAVGADEAAAGGEVVATVGEAVITRAELEQAAAAELRQVEQQRYEILARGLEQAVADKLLELEAASRGVSTEELLNAEVDAKLTPPGDAEVDAFYEQNKSRINQPKEQIADRIRQFLEQQGREQALEGYLAGLRDKYAVDTFLEPMRVAVEADGFPTRGPEGAPVTVVEFSDFECPYCSRVVPALDKVKEVYGDKVRLVFRQFPLNNIHPNAQKAAEASLCAHDQGKFWPMHDAMFGNQRQLGVEQLKQAAAGLGLDGEKFAACLDSDSKAEMVQKDLEAGMAAGVSGTPAMFINGRPLSGAQPFEAIAAIIDEELDNAGG